MTERHEYVDADSEKLADHDTVERFAHPAHHASEHAGEPGQDGERRDGQTSPTPDE